MKQETAKQRREKRRNNLDNDDDDDVCNMRAFRRVLPYLIGLLLYVPVDIALWSTDLVDKIKFIRILRLIPCPVQLVRHMEKIERSQAISFVMARSIRLIVTFLLVLHWVSCAWCMLASLEIDAAHPSWEDNVDISGSFSRYLHGVEFAMSM